MIPQNFRLYTIRPFGLFAALLLAAVSASAETWYLKTANNTGNLTTPSHWTNSVGTAATAFSSDDIYMVDARKELRTPGGSLEFGGGELHLGNGVLYGQMNVYSERLTFGLLKLNYGTVAQQGDHGSELALNGAVKAVGPSNTMRWLYNRQTTTLNASLSGDSSAKISTHVRYPTSGHRNERFVLAGDCSDFNGTIDVKVGEGTSGQVLAPSEWFVKLVLATENFSMPGKVTVAGKCALEITAANATLGSLALLSGAILDVNASSVGGLDVTGTLTFTAPQRVRMASVPTDGLAHTIDVLTAPAGKDLDPADFALEGDEFLPFATLGVRTRGDGRKTLTISYAPMVELTTSDNASLDRAANSTANTAWHSDASWSNGLRPQGGTNYIVRMQNGNKMYFRTPSLNGNITFPGASLTIGSNCCLRVFQGGDARLTVQKLRMLGGSEINHGSSTYGYVAGGMQISGGQVRFGVCGQTMKLQSVFSGSGDVWFAGPSTKPTNMHGTYQLLSNNPDFKGHWRVEYDGDNADYSARRIVVTADSELQLGGRLDAFDFKALTLRRYGHLTTRGSFSMTTNYNRGVFVDGAQGGVLNVADAAHALTFNTQLTLNGKLYKAGPGTLVMGGRVKFGNSAADTPTEGSNLFIVTNGTVKVTAADALNGLETTFAPGTSLVLAVDPDNADLTRYGIRNVKTSAPFAVADGGTLPFSLEASAAVKAAARGRALTLGLFTVTSEADETFRPLVPSEIRSPIPSSKGTVVRNEADGLVTYSLSVTPLGLRIIFR